jgi:hypothetical protein
MSSPGTAVGDSGGTPARQLTEPMRELCVFALLAGNAVFLLLGLTRLLLVVDGWGSQFGPRSVNAFPTFVGPVSLALPMAAMLLATHISPMVARSRAVVLTVLVEYGVSALFGLITFLGAFAQGLFSARATVEGTLERGVWLGFLVVAGAVALRLQLGLFPRPRRHPYAAGYLPTTYGQPYPGQPVYPHTHPLQHVNGGSPTSIADDPYAQAATSGSGWPAVPPPPMPAPIVIDPDPTTRLALPVPVTAELGGDATQVVRAPDGQVGGA